MSRLLELGCGVGVQVCRLMAGSCGVEASKLWLVVALTCALLADLTSVLETHVGAQREDNESKDGNSDGKSHHSWVSTLCYSSAIHRATPAHLRRELAQIHVVTPVHDESK